MKTYDRPVRWMLSWFKKDGDDLVGEMELNAEEEELRKALSVPADVTLEGEWPIDKSRRAAIERLAGCVLDLERFEYCVGAESV